VINPEIIDYFNILCPQGIPAFIEEYSNAPEMLRLKGIGLFCGTDYSKIYNHRYFYSRFEHSIAVALLIWRFTRDKKQAIAGLFHDIATPVFSHSVDFMNGDALTQKSTEERTHATIRSSGTITELLARDCIDL
jgi:HD superfamily phosphohydrolase